MISRLIESKRATDYLNKIQSKHDGKFEPSIFKKIIKYHPVHFPLVNESFVRLQGRSSSNLEKVLSIRYFICSSLFDDFWDEGLLDEQRIFSISMYPNVYQGHSFEENVFKESHELLLSHVKNQDEYWTVFKDLYYAQKDSLKQFDPSTSCEEIQRITFSKGGNSVLMCRYYLDVDASEIEKDCWYQLGILIQLTNDIYDYKKDTESGIYTLPTKLRDVYAFERIYLDQIDNFKHLIQKLNVSTAAKKRFSLAMASIYALGLVAIEQFKNVQGTNNMFPEITSLTRQQLIVDMEKASNIFSWIKYLYRHTK